MSDQAYIDGRLVMDTKQELVAEIDRLRAQVDTLAEHYNAAALDATRLRAALRKFVTEGLTRAEANAMLASTAQENPCQPQD